MRIREYIKFQQAIPQEYELHSEGIQNKNKRIKYEKYRPKRTAFFGIKEVYEKEKMKGLYKPLKINKHNVYKILPFDLFSVYIITLQSPKVKRL